VLIFLLLHLVASLTLFAYKNRYLWLTNPQQAGSFALLSIGISAMTTGFTSAMISFDMDVDVTRRKTQPSMYGYIPNDNGLRGRCFVLMTLISALHNLSRSLAFALLAAAPGGGRLLLLFLSCEFGLFYILKIARGDFFYWVDVNGMLLSLVIPILERAVSKIIADFSGCLHCRHPYEMGGLVFSMNMVWAQVFPFVALQVRPDDGKSEARSGTR